jgi:hypothetical protein
MSPKNDSEFNVQSALQIINLHEKENEYVRVIQKLNELIDEHKAIYDKLYQQHLQNVEEHNKLIEAFDLAKEVCIHQDKMRNNFKKEIKNLNKTIEKKNQIINKMQEDYNNFQIIKNMRKQNKFCYSKI